MSFPELEQFHDLTTLTERQDMLRRTCIVLEELPDQLAVTSGSPLVYP